MAALRDRAGLATLLVAGTLLPIVWLTMPHSPPLYDGLVGPAGPYKYVNPPAGLSGQHRNPTSGRTIETVKNGKFTVTTVATKESVPQALLELGDGAVVIPSGVTRVTLAIRPVAPPGPVSGGTLDGNVYLFTARGDNGRPLALNPKIGGLLQLRKTGQELSAHVERYSRGSWAQVPTLGFVNANYLATDAKSFGYYALIAPSNQSTFLTRYLPLLIAGAVILVLVITALVAIRLARRSRAPEGVT